MPEDSLFTTANVRLYLLGQTRIVWQASGEQKLLRVQPKSHCTCWLTWP